MCNVQSKCSCANKSGFVRRAERKIAKLEIQLEAARNELARQIELDVVRAQQKVERIAAKRVEKKAARDANPERVFRETKMLLLSLCVDRNLRCTDEMVAAFLQWKTAVEFPPKTNRYQKAIQFLKEREEDKGVPIFAKTMTGELIPLVYHSDRDKRDLLLQLEEVDSEQFPLGSTNIVRIADDPSKPVEAEEIFGLYKNGATLVRYAGDGPFSKDMVRFGFTRNTNNKLCVCYNFSILPEGIVPHQRMKIDYSERIMFEYYHETQEITCYGISNVYPLSEIRELVKNIRIRSYKYTSDYTTLTEQAQDDLIAVFETLRRDL